MKVSDNDMSVMLNTLLIDEQNRSVRNEMNDGFYNQLASMYYKDRSIDTYSFVGTLAYNNDILEQIPFS